MDKPSQTKSYSGLIIYRIQRNVEYLLLNDSFTNKKDWFCPKGPVLGNEDDTTCALRETFEATGLRPSDLRIEEKCVIELQYLLDTRPTKEKYQVAQLLDTHARLLLNAGVHMQWCTQPIASEKMTIKPMQQIFKIAQSYIDTKLTSSQPDDHHLYLHHRSPLSPPPPPPPSKLRQPLPPSPPQPISSPLYKTRLCERFETEGACPYGPKCNFAHGINELRGRGDQPSSLSSSDPILPIPTTTTVVDNQLFKTKLCEKFMKEKFCQYGPKCHFAHGENELKERPKKEEVVVAEPIKRQQQQQQQPFYEPNNNGIINRSTETSWRSSNNDRRRSPSSSSSSEDEIVPRPEKDLLRSSLNPPTTPPPVPAATAAIAAVVITEKETVNVEELRRPAFIDHQQTTRPIINKKTAPKEKKPVMVAPVTTEKSWMKIMKLSKEEQDEMESHVQQHQQQKTTLSAKLTAQTESIISDLKKFFSTHVNDTIIKGKLQEDVKEVTKIEMRNDLSKKQLLYILLASLLEDASLNLVTILKSREHLFKTLVKTNADQILLLKAWDSFVTLRKPIMINKTSAALSYWYDSELIEEEAFVQWYDLLQKESPLEKKSAKFIEWLNTEDDDSE